MREKKRGRERKRTKETPREREKMREMLRERRGDIAREEWRGRTPLATKIISVTAREESTRERRRERGRSDFSLSR